MAINVIIDSENDTMWTTQKTMTELFGKNIKTISKHLTNIFESEELVKLEVTFNPNDFNNTEIVIINPDAIISVGYRDQQTGMLREILKKGSRFRKDFFATERTCYSLP